MAHGERPAGGLPEVGRSVTLKKAPLGGFERGRSLPGAHRREPPYPAVMTCPGRRTVLKGFAAACGAGALSACGGDGNDAAAPAPATSEGAPSSGGLRASLTSVEDVPEGGAVSTAAPDGSKVLVSRLPGDEVLAFSAVCPHEGCTVAPDEGQFSCPCHGSQFELNGDLKRGPARKGLTPFPVRVMDGQVLPA